MCVWVGSALAAAPGHQGAHAEDEVCFDHLALIQSNTAVLVIVVAALAGILFLRKRAKSALDFLTGRRGLSSVPAADRREKPAEEEDLARFVTEFRAGPLSAPSPKAPYATRSFSRPTAAPVDGDTESARQLKEVFAWAPEQAATLRKLVEKCGRAESQAAQHNLLVDACCGAAAWKERVSLPELRPAWQLAGALEGLLKQLTSRVSTITHSTLRTVANGVELLEDLCTSGLSTDLTTNPAIRILAVDDDAVSRFALSAALKRTFDVPDVASSGDAALAMVRQQHYDLIILDVMMPGMDGFEVCVSIRETALNCATPVLFVTTLKDFDSRIKSLSIGGNDLMGKPFLTFELTLKALTLVLRARLRDRNHIPGTSAVRWPAPSTAVSDEVPALRREPLLKPGPGKGPADGAPVVPLPPPAFSAAVQTGAAREISPAFLKYIAASVAEMKEQISAIGSNNDPAARRETLVRLYLWLQLLSREVDRPEWRPAFEMCGALEGLFKKLQEDPKKATTSALQTAVAGLELFEDLCAPGVRPDLTSNPPIRILVVDDEPLSRRAITCALQMVFPKPDGAEDGETALELAAEKEFDLVFLDVCMPEMDGFKVCPKIHETVPNRATPVVFLTLHSGEEFRAQSTICGGSDYVVKPFVFLEITVKVLVFALRGRLEKLKMTKAPDHASLVCETQSNPE
jgi:DNA-binding response OmpR family regulator